MPKDSDHNTKSAAYWTPCAVNCAAASARWVHFWGATAIHLILPPFANSAMATATKPKPIQIAHQSSLRNSSLRGDGRAERRGWDCSAISAMADSGSSETGARAAVQWQLHADAVPCCGATTRASRVKITT